ncbi:MAG: glycosyltransferase family 9 protein [Proteobacteria bacterium]|nr:MAG: glycosyltransferase family 9 protein [Pseudomonadota bacterium]
MALQMERGNARLKFFDRYLGPILIGLLMPVKLLRPKAVPSKPSTVGLLKTAAIGDTLLLSAIVSDLKAASPDVRITLFTGASNYEFAKMIEGVDQLVKVPLTNPLAAVKLIRSYRFDAFIDFDPWPRISALLAAFSRATVRIGFKTAGQYRHYMYDVAIEHRNDLHELDNYRALVRPLKINGTNSPQQLGHAWSCDGDTVVFHLWPSGTQSHLKEWDSKKWVELATRLGKLGAFSFILTGGKEDQVRSQRLISELPEEIRSKFTNLAGSSFKTTLRALQCARLLVSVNTGIMHVAAAMGVPTVGLHGPTSPKRWGPVGIRTRSVISDSPDAGTLNLGFEYRDGADYMGGLSVDTVFAASEELLRG